MSPLEFYLAQKGYANKYYKGLEQTRLIAYTVACTVPSKKKLPVITKWMPLPTDSQTRGISEEKALAIFEKIKKQKNGN